MYFFIDINCCYGVKSTARQYRINQIRCRIQQLVNILTTKQKGALVGLTMEGR
jgi:hypothetical protein